LTETGPSRHTPLPYCGDKRTASVVIRPAGALDFAPANAQGGKFWHDRVAKTGILFFVRRWKAFTGPVAHVWRIHDDIYRPGLYVRGRSMRSHYLHHHHAGRRPPARILQKPKLVLAPGPLGYFDDRGAMVLAFAQVDLTASSIITIPVAAPSHDVTFEFAIGRAIFRSGKAHHHQGIPRTGPWPRTPQPVSQRRRLCPARRQSLAHVVHGGVNWEKQQRRCSSTTTPSSTPTPPDGIHWEASPEVCIPFQYETEYAIARPSVTKIGDTYHMWYTYRETPTIHTYRIGLRHLRRRPDLDPQGRRGRPSTCRPRAGTPKWSAIPTCSNTTGSGS